jgi:succinyl-CoA synthetase beta subunit
MKLVVKPDMLFGKRGKSGLVALNLDLAQVRQFVKERLGNEVLTFCHAFPGHLLMIRDTYMICLMDVLVYVGRDGRLQSSNHNLHC